MKPFHGKVIYNPSGKAGEYSQWAANFYNGCSARCEYCYNRHGRSAKVVGGDVPTLKKSLINNDKALSFFMNELYTNKEELQKHGLFFNFVSDPCLKETYNLNKAAILICLMKDIPIKLLTKQAWWINDFISTVNVDDYNLISIGFTLTGHDQLESGAATNQERIEAMKKLHDAGFKTWASIEPIIDLSTSFEMICHTNGFCDFYKIGLKSGGKYDKNELNRFIEGVIRQNGFYQAKIYFKDSLLKQAGINRVDLPSNCVDRTFNL